MVELDQSDEWLLQSIAARNHDALEVLYDRHAQVVYNVIVRIVRDTAAADEILHDTFWLVWQNAHTFRGGGAPAAWMYRIARNRSLDELRRQKTRPEPIATTDEVAEQEMVLVDANAPSVEEQAEHKWRSRHLRHVLKDIPSEQRQCLELAYFDGLSQREIATVMGTPLGTVKTRMRIGLEKLERVLRSTGWNAEDV